VELLVVIAIISLLVAVLLPAVNSAREAARRTDCANRIKQIGVAAINYEAAFKRFPPGYLGPKDFIEYSEETQWLGSLAYLLPYMEQKALYDRIDTSFSVNRFDDPFWSDAGSWFASQWNIGAFACPSADPADPSESYIVSITPFIKGKVEETLEDVYSSSRRPCAPKPDGELFITIVFTESDFVKLGTTNYTGVSGFAGHVGDRWVDLCEGVMNNRSKVAASRIKDGASNTLLYGEVAGTVERSMGVLEKHTWLSFGALPTGMGLDPSRMNEDDKEYLAHAYQFSSLHSGGIIQFVMADGSVQSLNNTMDTTTYLRLSTMRLKDVPGEY
jgi:type II secretory pathway pseudopilin PulG